METTKYVERGAFYFRYFGHIIAGTLFLVTLYPSVFLPIVLAFCALVGTPQLLGRKAFARLMHDFTPEYNEISHSEKAEHFKSLGKIVSADPVLRQRGQFRMLEIGAGTGANLDYYPDNCVLVASDDNPAMETYFRC